MELNVTNIVMLFVGVLLGTLIGYIIATIRIGSYLRKYYPEVDFQQSRKERNKIIEERPKEREIKTDENLVEDYLSQNKDQNKEKE